MGDLNPYTYTESAYQTKGSSIIQETSYSGCDIKVLVHIYNPTSSAALSGTATSKQLGELEKQRQSLERQTSELETKLTTTKQGTPAAQKYAARLASLASKTAQIEAALQSSNADHGEESTEQGTTKVLMELQTLSISLHRDKQPVRALGSVYPRGYCRGGRLLAGTMVATVFDKHAFYDFMQSHPSDFDGWNYTSSVADQIPPMDLTVVFANELGALSRMALYGVEFTDEGLTLSIQDILTETTFNYVARDYDPMRAVNKRKLDANNQMMAEWQGKKASELIFESDYQDTKTALDPFQRFNIRSNPYY